jgi:hypothetical protein
VVQAADSRQRDDIARVRRFHGARDRRIAAKRHMGSVVVVVPSSMTTRAHPFHDDLAAAVERAARLARENAALRATLAARGFDWFQWILVSLIALCSVAMTFILATWQ